MPATATSEENKRTVRRFMDEVSGKGNIELVDELVAEDVVDHTALGETRGRAALKETFEGLSAAFPTHENTIEEIVAEDDTVAIRVSSRLTHEGEFMGIEPTGQEVQIEGMSLFRLQDGKIVERWVQFDMFGMMQQLGVIEPPVPSEPDAEIEVDVEVSRVIDHPVADVFSFHAENHHKNHPRWDPDIELEKETDGPTGVGTVLRRRNTRYEDPVEGTMTVLAYEPNELIAMRIEEGQIEMNAVATYEALGPDRTELTLGTTVPDEIDPDMIRSGMQRTLETIEELLGSEE